MACAQRMRKLLLAENGSSKISLLSVHGDQASVMVIKEGLETLRTRRRCRFRCRSERMDFQLRRNLGSQEGR